jgi:hypothetical protein
MLTRVLGLGDNSPAFTQIEAVPSIYAEPPPALAVTSAGPKVPQLAVPSMSLARNPPFRRSDPDKPLSCRPETAPTGRVRIVCS